MVCPELISEQRLLPHIKGSRELLPGVKKKKMALNLKTTLFA